MFNMITKLTKAAVAVTLAPVALVVDVVTLPASTDDFRKGPFDRTAELLKIAGKNVKDSVK